MKIAVIGGGWSGLAAAVELTAGGADTTLFEAGRRLGGRARSIQLDGQTLDNGQHILLGAYSETLALMRRVGADPDQLFDRRPLQVTDKCGFSMALPKLPAPLNVAWGLFAAKGVGLREKINTALWMEGVKQRGFQVDAQQTVAEWLDAAGQTGALRQHLWGPLCLAALNTTVDRASAQLFANVLRDSLGSSRRADTDLLLPRVPFGELLPEPAERWLRSRGASLRTGCRVESILADNSGITLDGEHFSAVILATAPQHAARLWPAMDAHYDYEPIATVYLQFRPETKLPFPLQSLNGKCGQWVVDRGNGLFACVQSGQGDWTQLDDTTLAAQLQSELGLGEPASWFRVVREKRATFSCRPGITRPACASSHPLLFLAGDYTWAEYPATLEGAVRSGLRAARQALSL